MFALDTNTLIYFFKGQGKVAQTLLNTPPREIAIPTVVLYELEVGIAKSTRATQRRQQLDQLTALVTLLPFHSAAARCCAEIRAALEAKGLSIGPMATLIAGIALSHGATLVTHNTAEFLRVVHDPADDVFSPRLCIPRNVPAAEPGSRPLDRFDPMA